MDLDESQLRQAIIRYIEKQYGGTTLVGEVVNMNSPEGPPRLRARLLRDVRGVLAEIT